jgi:predicted O-methyltransferase YrrM
MLGDIVLRLEQEKGKHWELGEECLNFFKAKWTVDQYDSFFSRRADFHHNNIFELGIWDGGSTVFWFECLRPQKIVAVDLQRREDSLYFKRYVSSRGLEQRVKTIWGVNQADPEQLRAIVRNEFEAPLDLVIDDASHMYAFTEVSFQTLFPLLRPGGLYIIEDWAWAHWKEFQDPSHPWAKETELTRLILEFVEAIGSTQSFSPRKQMEDSGAETVSDTVFNSLTIFPHFAVVERGDLDGAVLSDFKIDQFISRRENPLRGAGLFSRLRMISGLGS